MLLATGARQDPSASGLLEPVELRALVIRPTDLDVLGDRAHLAAAMDRLHEIGFDAVVPLVWEQGRVLFPSPALAKIATGETALFPGRDVLQEIVFEAHRAGLEVLPAIDGTFACKLEGPSAPKLPPRTVAHDRPDPRHADVRAFAHAFALDVARTAEVDGLVLIDGLPAFDRLPTPDKTDARKTAADAVIALRGELRALDPSLVLAWAVQDASKLGPAELGLLERDVLDFVLLREPPKDAQDPLAVWIAAKPRRAALWVALDPAPKPDELLVRLASARQGGFAGEALGPFAALAGEGNALVDALTQGVDAPYYARATLPWRDAVVWRPRAEPIAGQVDAGNWEPIEDPSGLAAQKLPAGESGSLSWRIRPESSGQYELWAWMPTGAEGSARVAFTVIGQRTGKRVPVDPSTPKGRGRVFLGRTSLSAGESREALRLEVAEGLERPALVGPVVALIHRRPDGW